jgi:GTP cyclohydrolase I
MTRSSHNLTALAPVADIEDAITTLLRYIGEDPSRDGLRDAPTRVARAWREMTRGYEDDPAEILARTFEESSDEMIVLRGISFYSTCEHHLLPFYGTATVGYLPGKVVGISKLARLVECFARRLQIQERMTRQIAEAIETHLDARGVGVILRAHHLCMGCRGVRQEETEMVTSSMLGTLRSDATSRSEFLCNAK